MKYLAWALACAALPALAQAEGFDTPLRTADRDILVSATVSRAGPGNVYTDRGTGEHTPAVSMALTGATYWNDGLGAGPRIGYTPGSGVVDASYALFLRAPIHPRFNFHVYPHLGPRVEVSDRPGVGVQGGLGLGVSVPMGSAMNLRLDWLGQMYDMGPRNGHRVYLQAGLELAL